MLFRSVEIGSNRIDINLKNQPIPGVKITCYTGIMDDPTLTDRLLKAGVQCSKTVPDNSSYLILNIVANVLPLVMIGFIFSTRVLYNLNLHFRFSAGL